MTPRYLDPLSDFGFKHLFGSEPNKDLLLTLLNALLPLEHQIERLDFRSPEWAGHHPYDRRALFDVYCVSTAGERFVVEVQRARQAHFRDRCLYYSTFPIQQQGLRGDWDFRLSAVYVVAILDFEFRDLDRSGPAADRYLHIVQLADQSGRVFYDKYMQVYVELPRFRKTDSELVTEADKWLYFLRRAAELEAPPPGLDSEMIRKALSAASLAKLTPHQREMYEEVMRERSVA